MATDYILNGQGYGPVGEALGGYDFDAGLMRPFLDSHGNRCVMINTGKREHKKDGNGKLIVNRDGDPIDFMVRRKEIIGGPRDFLVNSTTLRKEEWVYLDRQVNKAARDRLQAWPDLVQSGVIGGFDGYSNLIYEYENMSDPGEAFMDMDVLTEGRNMAPRFQLQGIPLPIIHVGWWISARRLAVTRKNNTPFSSTTGEAAGRRCAEKLEDVTIGTIPGVQFGTDSRYGRASKVHGYMTFPDRIVSTDLTKPTTVGWSPQTFYNEVNDLIEVAADNQYYGPFMLYVSTDWAGKMQLDYAPAGGNNQGDTLRTRLLKHESIKDVRRLDRLRRSSYPWTILLVQMTPEVSQAIQGMDLTTVQWESMGGAKVNFRTMVIGLPLLKSDINGHTGIIHAVGSR